VTDLLAHMEENQKARHAEAKEHALVTPAYPIGAIGALLNIVRQPRTTAACGGLQRRVGHCCGPEFWGSFWCG